VVKQETQVRIRPAELMDGDAVWSVIELIIRSGETYTLPADMSREDALTYWFSEDNQVFVAEYENKIAGTYYLKANHTGGGKHVANSGYVTATSATGRGIAQAMFDHSLERAKERGFRAIQFNFVVSSNERAVKLWQRNGFEIVGRLPAAFLHPNLGYVDAYVMFRKL
jgi:ribosomal protein S18 acetylase RimI-like enzyme